MARLAAHRSATHQPTSDAVASSTKSEGKANAASPSTKRKASASEEKSPKKARATTSPQTSQANGGASQRLHRVKTAATRAVPIANASYDFPESEGSQVDLQSSRTTPEEGATHSTTGPGVLMDESPASNTRQKTAAKAATAQDSSVPPKRGPGRPRKSTTSQPIEATSTPDGPTQPTQEPPEGMEPSVSTDVVEASRKDTGDDDAEDSNNDSEHAGEITATETESVLEADADSSLPGRAEDACRFLECDFHWDKIHKAVITIKDKNKDHKCGSEETKDLLKAIKDSKTTYIEHEKLVVGSRAFPLDHEQQLREKLCNIRERVNGIQRRPKQDEDRKTYKDIHILLIPGLVTVVKQILVSHYDNGLDTTILHLLVKALALTIGLCDRAFQWKIPNAKNKRHRLKGDARKITKNDIKMGLKAIRTAYIKELPRIRADERAQDDAERMERHKQARQERKQREDEEKAADIAARNRLIAEQTRKFSWPPAQSRKRTPPRPGARSPSPRRQHLTPQRSSAGAREPLEDIPLVEEDAPVIIDSSDDLPPDQNESQPKDNTVYGHGLREQSDNTAWTDEEDRAVADGIKEFFGTYVLIMESDINLTSATGPDRYAQILRKYGKGNGLLSHRHIGEVKTKAIALRDAMQWQAMEAGGNDPKEWAFIRGIKV